MSLNHGPKKANLQSLPRSGIQWKFYMSNYESEKKNQNFTLDWGNKLTATELTMSLNHGPEKAIPQSLSSNGNLDDKL